MASQPPAATMGQGPTTSKGPSTSTNKLKNGVRGFTPAWFTITIGTGIVSNCFTNLPFGQMTSGVRFVAVFALFFNILLFSVFTFVSLVRFVIWPKQVSKTINHPTHSLYFSTVPMAATTIINVTLNLVYNGFHYGNKAFVYGVWAFWWVNVAVTLWTSFGLIHTLTTVHRHSFEQLTSLTIYPSLPLAATASSGPLLAVSLAPFNLDHALVSIAFGAVLEVFGLSLLVMLTTMYFYRLVVHGYPEGAAVVSMALMISGFAQPGVTMCYLGQVSIVVFPLKDSGSPLLQLNSFGPAMYAFSIAIAFGLWATTTMWLVFIVLAVQRTARQGMLPFQLPFWSMIFPIGIYAILTILLSRNFDSPFLRVYGFILCIMTTLLWLLAFFRTLRTIPQAGIFDNMTLESTGREVLKDPRRVDAYLIPL
ncbi:voltage-dependent anion channel [Vararia minispora EC-137]|uniref:Voltage-dependent anion channel n=1 Tax=Vararia minispora EC-137 TaxID=1314806 RepID=A0ACB8QVK6_9AGAM|nr:voltage-dependent anion channel [Vararia minispora EC-137]